MTSGYEPDALRARRARHNKRAEGRRFKSCPRYQFQSVTASSPTKVGLMLYMPGKVAGSNPAPATNNESPVKQGFFYGFGLFARRAALSPGSPFDNGPKVAGLNPAPATN
jgi:hypothetical protein